MDHVRIANQKSVIWGVFWGMTLFFLVWCVIAPIAVIMIFSSRDLQQWLGDPLKVDTRETLFEREQTALVKPGYAGRLKCWAGEYRSDIDSYAGLLISKQDRFVQEMHDNGRIFAFEGEVEVLAVDYGSHLTGVGLSALRVYYVKFKVLGGLDAATKLWVEEGATLWGLLTDLNDPTGSN